MQNALAVGKTLEQLKKAELTTHYLWVSKNLISDEDYNCDRLECSLKVRQNTCYMFLVILIPKMKLILEQEWMKGLYTCGDCKTEYSKRVDLPKDPRCRSESFYFGFVLAFLAKNNSGLAEILLNTFGKEYSLHAKIAKVLKEKNEEIYSAMMVGIVG